MKKRIVAIMLMVCAVVAMAGCGNSAKQADTSASTHTVAPSTSTLPKYVYTGQDPYMSAVCDHILKTDAVNYDQKDVMIPVPVVYMTDDSNKSDIKIWADFCVDGFTLEDERLIFGSGGVNSGVIHLKQTENGYTVTDYQIAADGAQWTSNLKKLCEGNDELFNKFINPGTLRDEAEVNIISDYVKSNNLTIKGYEIGGRTTAIK